MPISTAPTISQANVVVEFQSLDRIGSNCGHPYSANFQEKEGDATKDDRPSISTNTDLATGVHAAHLRGPQICGKAPARCHLVSSIRVDTRVHVPDVGINGRVMRKIRTLIIQVAFQRDHQVRHGVVVDMAAEEHAASLQVLPKKWKEHVTQMPTGHGSLSVTDNRPMCSTCARASRLNHVRPRRRCGVFLSQRRWHSYHPWCRNRDC